MLERNDALIERFNKDEQKHRRLERRKRARRKRLPLENKEFHKFLDRLDELTERQKPADCVSQKWVGSSPEANTHETDRLPSLKRIV